MLSTFNLSLLYRMRSYSVDDVNLAQNQKMIVFISRLAVIELIFKHIHLTNIASFDIRGSVLTLFGFGERIRHIYIMFTKNPCLFQIFNN